MKIVKISSKKQITLPSELLLDLSLQPMEKLVVQAENDTLVLKPLRTSVVEQTAGSLTKFVSSSKLGVSLSKIRRETKEKTAAKLAKNL